jgi:hypothetical protein
MKADEIVNEITRRAWAFGVAVLLSPEEGLDLDGSPCSGWFDHKPPRLECAVGNDEKIWLGVLLHEYSHLTQWVENCKAWQDIEASGEMWEWLDGKKIKNPQLVIENTKELEADCERRTVRLIKELSAPIDIDVYCQQANAYIHFHNVIKDKRKWVKASGALRHPEILKHCNKTLDYDYKTTPKPLYDALVKHAL